MPKSKRARPSSTPGRSKGQNCQRSQLKNIHAKDSRAYRTMPQVYAGAALEVYKLNEAKGVGKSPWIYEVLNG